jgi:hypothetical protein
MFDARFIASTMGLVPYSLTAESRQLTAGTQNRHSSAPKKLSSPTPSGKPSISHIPQALSLAD